MENSRLNVLKLNPNSGQSEIEQDSLPTQFSPRTKWSHLLHAKMSQIGTGLYSRLVFHILIFSISTV